MITYGPRVSLRSCSALVGIAVVGVVGIAGCARSPFPAKPPVNEALQFPVTVFVGSYVRTASGCSGTGYWGEFRERGLLPLVDGDSHPVTSVRLSRGTVDQQRNECVMHFDATVPPRIVELWIAAANGHRQSFLVSRSQPILVNGTSIGLEFPTTATRPGPVSPS